MTQSNKILVAVVAAVAASAAFFFLALSPKREQAAELKTQVATAQKTLDEAKATLANHERARAGYKTAYASVVRLGKAVPADDDVRSLVVQLDAAARKSGVDFRSIDVTKGAAASVAPPAGATPAQLPPGATVGPAGFPVMPFAFTFNGSFFKLSDFFARLERFVSVSNKRIGVTGRLLTLDSLALEPHTDGFPKIKAQVGATSYLVSPLEGLTGGATQAGPGTAQPAAAGASAPTPATTTGAIR